MSEGEGLSPEHMSDLFSFMLWRCTLEDIDELRDYAGQLKNSCMDAYTQAGISQPSSGEQNGDFRLLSLIVNNTNVTSNAILKNIISHCEEELLNRKEREKP